MAAPVETGGERARSNEPRSKPAGIRIVSTADPEVSELIESHPGPLLVVGEPCPAGLLEPGRPPRGWAPPDLPEAQRRRLEQLLAEGLSVCYAEGSSAADRRARAERAPTRGGLSSRELEVLDLVSDGWSNPEIARVLDISVHTVKYHLARLLARLEAANRAELVRRAAELGMLRV